MRRLSRNARRTSSSIESLRPPSALVHAVTRCLARHPEDRWPDGVALRDALLEGVAVPRKAGLLRRVLKRR